MTVVLLTMTVVNCSIFQWVVSLHISEVSQLLCAVCQDGVYLISTKVGMILLELVQYVWLIIYVDLQTKHIHFQRRTQSFNRMVN